MQHIHRNWIEFINNNPTQRDREVEWNPLTSDEVPALATAVAPADAAAAAVQAQTANIVSADVAAAAVQAGVQAGQQVHLAGASADAVGAGASGVAAQSATAAVADELAGAPEHQEQQAAVAGWASQPGAVGAGAAQAPAASAVAGARPNDQSDAELARMGSLGLCVRVLAWHRLSAHLLLLLVAIEAFSNKLDVLIIISRSVYCYVMSNCGVFRRLCCF
jgi:hypothetical protein